MKQFTAFLDHVLPDKGDQARLQMFFGSFLTREPPMFLVLCGNGAGSLTVIRLIEELLGSGNVSRVPAYEMWNPRSLGDMVGVACNIIKDLTCQTAYVINSRHLERLITSGIFFAGDDQSYAPRMVIYSLFVPCLGLFSEALKQAAVILEFKTMTLCDVLWPDIADEIDEIRSWAKAGVTLVKHGIRRVEA